MVHSEGYLAFVCGLTQKFVGVIDIESPERWVQLPDESTNVRKRFVEGTVLSSQMESHQLCSVVKLNAEPIPANLIRAQY